MRRIIGSVVVLGLAAGCPAPESEEKIKVGAIISLTGSYGALGSERLQGAVLAVEEINAAGGVLGQKLELVSRDDGTDPATAKVRAEELVGMGVPAIIGPSASGCFMAAAEATIPKKVVQISGSATSPLVSELTDDGFANRTCSPDTLQGRLLARRAMNRGFDKVAIIHAPGAYGVGLADSAAAALTGLGGEVTLKRQIVEGENSYEGLLNEVYATQPKAIFLIVYNFEGTQIVKDYLNVPPASPIFWFFTDSLAEQEFVTGIGADQFKNVQHEGTGPAAPSGARAETFATAYESKFGKKPEPTSFAANYYDAMYLLALAMEAGGKADSASIRDNLLSVSKGGKEHTSSTLKQALEDLRGGVDVDFQGVSGNLDLDERGDPVAPYDIWHVADGKLSVFEPGVSP